MKGSYCLIINLKSDSIIKIGSLGKIKFKKGNYVYIGSALNNLEKRIQRHQRLKKKIHWHIDYLLKCKNAMIKKVYYKESNKKEECFIAKKIDGKKIIGFGCSDCSCTSHLIKIKKISDWLLTHLDIYVSQKTYEMQ